MKLADDDTLLKVASQELQDQELVTSLTGQPVGLMEGGHDEIQIQILAMIKIQILAMMEIQIQILIMVEIEIQRYISYFATRSTRCQGIHDENMKIEQNAKSLKIPKIMESELIKEIMFTMDIIQVQFSAPSSKLSNFSNGNYTRHNLLD